MNLLSDFPNNLINDKSIAFLDKAFNSDVQLGGTSFYKTYIAAEKGSNHKKTLSMA